MEFRRSAAAVADTGLSGTGLAFRWPMTDIRRHWTRSRAWKKRTCPEILLPRRCSTGWTFQPNTVSRPWRGRGRRRASAENWPTTSTSCSAGADVLQVSDRLSRGPFAPSWSCTGDSGTRSLPAADSKQTTRANKWADTWLPKMNYMLSIYTGWPKKQAVVGLYTELSIILTLINGTFSSTSSIKDAHYNIISWR